MSYPARTLCDVLAAIRTAYETRNISYLLGLVEEAQVMGDRMEAGLVTKRGRIRELEREVARLKGEPEPKYPYDW